jgi:polysaccharide pyruvyl transferase WcaK-like protein
MEQMKSNSSRRKICFFGIFGSGNLGNEATFCAILASLRRIVPNAEIACICSGPQETAAEYNISAFPMKEKPLPPVKDRLVRALRRIFVGIPMEFYRWYRAISILKDADMLVMTGTGMLGDFGILPANLHYEIVKWSVAAKLCRCKLLFVSVGVGPIRHRLSRILVKTALRLADYRSYRDDFSKDYLEGMHFDTKNDFVCPDLAFSLPRTMIPADVARDRGATVVGVGIMTYRNKSDTGEADDSVYHTYIAKLSLIVSWLLNQGYIVRLLIGDAVYDERIRQDLRLALDGKGIKYERAKIIDDPASSVSDVLSQLAATDTVIASRFHNVLLALLLGKPVLAISYHEKVDALMAGLGLADFCQDIEDIDVDKLIEQFTTIEQCAGILKPQIAQKAEAYREALEVQYERIFAAVPK